MKQLIPQSKIDEAAKLHIYECIEKSEYDRSELSFNAVFQFALTEIQPLMVECLNYAFKNYHSFDGIIVPITTKQLLEEFINYKNK